MLKKRSIRKILASFSVLFAMVLVYLVPKDKEYSLDIKKTVFYRDKNVILKTVYLLDQNDYVARSKIVSNKKDLEVIDKAKELLDVLIIGSKSESLVPNGFKQIIPSDTKILGIKFEDGLLKVNFSKELLDVSLEYEEKMIESIIYTLTSIDEVKKIIIYVDGDILSKLPKSNINLPSTLDRNYGVNKDFKLTKVDNYQKVTVYYINKFNDNYYYVPVTKYLNDDRDKIKIIVDELSSSYVYNTNLMSFLNNNTKLLSSSLEGDILNLTFNKYLFNNIEDKDILEEVIYTISLSMADNFNIKEVNFIVEDNEIYKSVIKTLE